MDDLTDKLNSILSDPKMMEQIKGLSGMFLDKPEKEEVKKEPKLNDCNDSSDVSNDTMQIVIQTLSHFISFFFFPLDQSYML